MFFKSFAAHRLRTIAAVWNIASQLSQDMHITYLIAIITSHISLLVLDMT